MTPFLKSLLRPLTGEQQTDGHPAGLPRDTGIVTGFFYVVVLVGLGLLLLFSGDIKSSAVAVIWAFACFSSGTFVGFLFGVPKIQQSEDNKAGVESRGSYQQRVNTNLTEISDWLTKIIVGLGLINLTNIPPLLKKAAQYLSNGILGGADPESREPFALGLIVFFSVMGFLFGYLSTRLFLAPAFSKADQEAAEIQLRQQREIDSTTAQLAAVTTAVRVLGTHSDEPSIADNQPAADSKQETGWPGPTKKTGTSQEQTAQEFGRKRLLELAESYTRIDSPDYMERVQRKDKAAEEMAALALRSGISKDWIAQQAESSGSDGLIVALASIASVAPDPSDLDRILRVAGKANWKHTKYRVAVAISNLFSQNLANPALVDSVVSLLSAYRSGADRPLLKMISQTQATIERATGRLIRPL